ncbi:SH3 domain-containing protein [Altererythrobacter sp. FM1]|uniref:SH3 domain-containing protein n=1 Tax=Tsuneonella flava TaxID=2055955 RepID=UPI000C80276A|nr:SH3 domain-containing protein [Tsuneonella flava]ROT97001.1 SH3 domain-containing protein [Altererythrobacter sp. FM1]
MRTLTYIFAIGAMASAAPALAAKNPPPELAKCDRSIGTIALIDGDVAGWSEYGLGSPRALLNALATESGCFTPQTDPSVPARFLMTAVAGNQEEVDKSVEMAKGAATEALVRSGAVGSILSKVPFGGSALGMFGGLGGKKKTVAAGLKVVSPMTGQTIAAGSGSVRKTSISFGNSGGFGWASNAASAAGYQGNKNGEQLAEAFIIAFNQVIAQRALLETAPAPGGSAAPDAEDATATVAVDSHIYAAPAKTAAHVRAVRAGTELNPTGKREGLFVEVTDNYGTTGWVSVEDLR